MQRGLFILLLEIFVCLALTGVGFWALIMPRRLQAFLNINYALLPVVDDDWQITPFALRVIGVLLIIYGYMFFSEYVTSLRWLMNLFI